MRPARGTLAGMAADADGGPERLKALWQRERMATRERFREERKNLPFAERVARGLALTDLEVSDVRRPPDP